MTITDKDFDQLADYGKLEINERDKAKLKTELNKIITSLEIIKEMDTTDVEPMVYVNDITNVFREDLVENNDYNKNQKLALKNAPSHKDGFISVPKMID